MDYSNYYDTTYKIIGAAMEVHREIGYGLLEAIYHEALCIEFCKRNINYASEQKLECFYKGQKLNKYYVADIVADNDIIIEIKSAKQILPEHRKQLFNYMKLTKKPIGIIINFGASSLQGHRYGYD